MALHRTIVFTAFVASLTATSCAKPPPPLPPSSREIDQQSPAVNQSGRVPPSIADVQRTLKDHGYAVTVDGRMGPKTKAALKKYQAKNGLTPNGVPDRATLVQLGLQ